MDNVKIYRERAMHARLGAKEATKPEFRAVFERLAESYEAMARDAEWPAPPAPEGQPNERGSS
jgi:hypothetical protein